MSIEFFFNGQTFEKGEKSPAQICETVKLEIHVLPRKKEQSGFKKKLHIYSCHFFNTIH